MAIYGEDKAGEVVKLSRQVVNDEYEPLDYVVFLNVLNLFFIPQLPPLHQVQLQRISQKHSRLFHSNSTLPIQKHTLISHIISNQHNIIISHKPIQ